METPEPTLFEIIVVCKSFESTAKDIVCDVGKVPVNCVNTVSFDMGSSISDEAFKTGKGEELVTDAKTEGFIPESVVADCGSVEEGMIGDVV